MSKALAALWLRGNYFALPRSECFGGSVDFLPFGTTLPTLWPIDPQSAEQRVIPRLPTSRPMAERQAFAGVVFSVMPAAAATGARDRYSGLTPIKVTIHSVALYEDPDLERLLYAFPLDIPAPSVLLTGVPERVPAANEALLNKESAALLLLKNRGDVLGANAWTRLAARPRAAWSSWSWGCPSGSWVALGPPETASRSSDRPVR